MRVEILWLYIGSEFAVLAFNLSLERQKTGCVADLYGTVSVFTNLDIWGFNVL